MSGGESIRICRPLPGNLTPAQSRLNLKLSTSLAKFNRTHSKYMAITTSGDEEDSIASMSVTDEGLHIKGERGRVPGRRSRCCGFPEVLGLSRAEFSGMNIGIGECKMTAR